MVATGKHMLRVGVIGTGKISEEHLRFLAARHSVTLSGVCDLSPSLARYAVDRFGAGTPYTDYAKLLEQARPDVVHVLTPPHTHAKLVADCLQGGADVIVEKPVAPTHGEFMQLWNIAEQNDRRLIEDHNYRFNQPILQIEKMVAAGKLGEIREVEVRMALGIREPGGRYADGALKHPSHNMPAGVIHEFITHLCYLMLRFMPDEVQRVSAGWSKHGDDAVFRYDDLDATVVGGKTHGRLRFSSHTGPDCFTVTVRGAQGWAETDLYLQYVRSVIPRAGGKQLTPIVNQLVNGLGSARDGVVSLRNKIMQKTPYEGLATFLGRTYDALESGAEPPVTFRDMDRAARLVDMLLAEENRF